MSYRWQGVKSTEGKAEKKVTEACALGYSEFKDLIGFTSKTLPYTILKNSKQQNISVCANT
jgi:hypothetical protein